MSNVVKQASQAVELDLGIIDIADAVPAASSPE